MVAAILTAGMLLAGCSGDSAGNAQPTPTGPPEYTQPANTPAAQLRSQFTAAMMDWTWLAAQATGGSSGQGEASAAAATALENATVELAARIGRQYADAEQPALAALRSRDVALMKYAAAKRSGDAAAQAAARQELDAFRTALAQVLAGQAPQISAERLAEALKPHVDGLLQVIDAQVGEGGGDRRKLLADAAEATAPAALVIAEGVTANKQLAGDVNSPAATLRADFTKALVNHTWLAGLLSNAALNGGGATSAEFQAADEALQANAVEFADVWGRYYPEKRDEFLASWRDHIERFKKYLAVARVNPREKPDKGLARVELENHRRTFGELISASAPELTPAAAADMLGAYLSSLLLVVESQAGFGDNRWYTLLPQASAQMPTVAATLAGAVTQNKQLEG